MAFKEIDEVELMNLRKLEQVAGTIMRNPKAKKLLELAHKEVDPNAITPSLDQERQIQEPINEALGRVKELETKLKERDAEIERNAKLSELNATIEAGLAELRKQGWQKEGLEQVDALMKEKGILDPMIAAAYIEKQHPQQQPAAPSGGSWNFTADVPDTDADMKSLLANRGEGPAVDKLASVALQEFRQGRR